MLETRRMRLLVTGGCGFIGSNFIRYVLDHYQPESITNVDLLTYAGSLVTTADFPLRFGDRYELIRADVADRSVMYQILTRHSYYAIVNFAAESHVDRSIASSSDFIHSNVVGANVLLELARACGVKRLVQVSTDEVYGSNESTVPSAETAPLNPSSPYSASKAAADLLALACHKTYEQDIVITRSSNNYGPYQYPEKLIPVLILRALLDEPLPIYGDGRHVRDWIHVEDYCAAIFDVLLEGRAGQIYNVAGNQQQQNIDVAIKILRYLGKSEDQIQFVSDRPGHDRRYSLDGNKIRQEIGWKPLHDFEDGLRSTIDWYRNNEPWWRDLLRSKEGR
jgi:dTDP-glucose 4,6-dehydratase